jgi:hypothetical protein
LFFFYSNYQVDNAVLQKQNLELLGETADQKKVIGMLFLELTFAI